MVDTQLFIALGLVAAIVGLAAWGYHVFQSHQQKKREGRGAAREDEQAGWELAPDGRLPPFDSSGPAFSSRPPEGGGSSPAEHPPALHRKLDLMITLTAAGPIEIGWLREALIAEFADAPQLPMRWYYFSDAQNRWEPLTVDSEGRAQRFLAALLLCNRSGCVGEREYARFAGGVERMADCLALACDRIEACAAVLKRAQALDRFSQAVDWQVAFNLRPRAGMILGTKVRAAAEAYGMRLEPDGVYRLFDEHGHLLFALMDATQEPFIAAEMRVRQVPALTLVCDIALIPTVAVFDRMVGFSEKLGKTLDAELVADDGTPLTPEMLKSVRAQIEKTHQQMQQFEIPPGSVFARRLFS